MKYEHKIFPLMHECKVLHQGESRIEADCMGLLFGNEVLTGFD